MPHNATRANGVADPSTMLREASSASFEPSSWEYAAFTNDAALRLKSWIDRPHGVSEVDSRKRLWQVRCACTEDDADSAEGENCSGRLRVLLVTGSTTMFAFTKYLAEAFGWRPAGKRYDTQPSKGALPAGSHWTIERLDERQYAEPGTPLAGMVGKQASVFSAAGTGAPYFDEKKVKVFQLLRRRGDGMVYRCSTGNDGGRRVVTVVLDGCTRAGVTCSYQHTPRCVGADPSLTKAAWSGLNGTYLRGKPAEMLLMYNATAREMEEMRDNIYKEPLFDNRGNGISRRTTDIAEMHRVVALPFREEEDEEEEEEEDNEC